MAQTTMSTISVGPLSSTGSIGYPYTPRSYHIRTPTPVRAFTPAYAFTTKGENFRPPSVPPITRNTVLRQNLDFLQPKPVNEFGMVFNPDTVKRDMLASRPVSTHQVDPPTFDTSNLDDEIKSYFQPIVEHIEPIVPDTIQIAPSPTLIDKANLRQSILDSIKIDQEHFAVLDEIRRNNIIMPPRPSDEVDPVTANFQPSLFHRPTQIRQDVNRHFDSVHEKKRLHDEEIAKISKEAENYTAPTFTRTKSSKTIPANKNVVAHRWSKDKPDTIEKGYQHIKSFSECVGSTNRTMFSKIEDVTSSLKPLTFMKMIADFQLSSNGAYRANILFTALEAYGLYWNSPSDIARFCAKVMEEGVSFFFGDPDNPFSILSEGEQMSGDMKVKTWKCEQPNMDLQWQANEKEMDPMLKKFFAMIGEKMPQNINKAAPVMKIVGPLALLAFTSLGFTDPGRSVNKVMHSMADSLKSSGTILNSFGSMHDFVGNSFKAAFENDVLAPKEALIKEITKAQKGLDAFELAMQKERTQILNNTGKLNELTTTCDDIIKLSEQYMFMKENMSTVAPFLLKLMESKNRVQTAFRKIQTTCSTRQEPVCVWFFGLPGAGKSKLVSYIVHLLGRLENTKLTNFVCTSSETYRSNYSGQDVYTYDDFGSSTEAPDIMEFIPIKSSEAYTMNMASIDEKGTQFSSRYIIICSNLSGITETSVISNPEAIDRRRDLFFCVEDAVAMQSSQLGQPLPAGHYKKDFSHLTITRFNPHKNKQGRYDVFVEGDPIYTPGRIAAAMKNCEVRYKTDHDLVLARDDEVDDPLVCDLDVTQQAPNQLTPADCAKLNRTFQGPLFEARNISKYKRQATTKDHGTPAPRVLRRDTNNRGMQPYMPAQQVWFNQQMQLQAGDIVVNKGTFSYFITGKGGLGKTEFARAIETEYPGKYIVFDECCMSIAKFQSMCDCIWDAEMDPNCKPVIGICNTGQWENIWQQVGFEHDAFMRRVIHLEFGIKLGASISYSVAGKALNIPDDIVIRKTTRFAGKDKTSEKMDYFKALLEVGCHQALGEVRMTNLFAPPVWDKPLPKDRICMKIHIAEWKDKSLKDFFAMFMTADVLDHTHITVFDKMKVAADLKETYQFVGEDLPSALVKINAKKIKPSFKFQIALVFYDGVVIFDSKTEEHYVCYTYESENIVAECEQLFASTASSIAEEANKLQTVFEAIDGIFYLLKMATGLGLGIHNILYMRKLGNHLDANPMQHEGEGGLRGLGKSDINWGDACGEPTEQMPAGPYNVPKAARSSTKIRDYCKDCHSSNCEHCIAYVNEDAYNADPKKHPIVKVAKQAPMEINKMAQEVLKSHRKGKLFTASRGGDEYREGPPLYTQPGSMMPVNGVGQLPQMTQIPLSVKDSQLVEQAMVDNNAADLIPLVTGNYVYIGANKQDVLLRGLMIKGRIGVTNMHAFSNRAVGDMFSCFDADGATYGATIIHQDSERDLTVFKLRRGDREFKDILHFVSIKADTATRTGLSAWILVGHPDKTATITNIALKDVTHTRIGGVKRYGQNYNGHAVGVEYAPINTRKGYCGSAIIICNPKVQRKIVCIHAAANETRGFGSMIFQEDFANLEFQALGPVGVDEHYITILNHQRVLPINEHAHGYYRVIGVAHDEEKGILHQYQSTQTRLYKSPLAWTEGVFEPVVLSKNDPRPLVDFLPYEAGLENFNHEQLTMDIPELDICVEEIADYYACLIRANDQIVFKMTKTEAVNGTSRFRSSNPIQRDTSPGYPWKHLTDEVKKAAYFAFDNERQIWHIRQDNNGRMLNAAIDDIINHAKKGERTCVVNCGTLKDEARPVRRVYDEPTTRAFWAAPLDKVMCDRMYFHTATAALADIHEQHPIKIGIDPTGMGFNDLFNWHAKVAMLGFDLDAKAWDSSVPVCVMERLYKIYNKIYEMNDPHCTDEDQQVRQTLHSHLIRPLILYRDFVVQLPGGNISGQTLTGFDNSFVNHIYHYYVWRKLCKQFDRRYLLSLDHFHENVRCSFYGDDVVDTVSLQARDMFSPENYIREAAKFGVICTPADKGKGKIDFKRLTELEFLKRNFVKAELPNGEISKYFAGALQLKTFSKMLDLVVYTKPHDFWKEPDVVKFDYCTITGTIQVALLEACNHGRKFFNEMRSHLMSCCTDYGIKLTSWPSYISCFNTIWDTDLPEGSQSAYREDDLQYQADKMPTQPAVVGENGAPSEINHPSAPAPLSGGQGAMGGTSGLVNQFTGEPGMLPMELYGKDIIVATIPWSSAQNAGTIIYTSVIAPSGSNEYVQYFSAPYNAWAGGFDWTITIVGTGFNGGKLGITKMPPNFSPTDATTLSDFTVFPYEAIDVKESNSITIIGPDERNVLYHWRGTDPTNIDFSGGTFVIFVISPLINSNGTANSVNIVISNKPDKSFRVAQLMPLSTLDDTSSNLSLAKVLMPGPQYQTTSPYTDTPITTIQTLAQAATPILTQYFYGQLQANGTPYSRPYQYWGRQNIVCNINAQTQCTLLGQAIDVTRPITLANSNTTATQLTACNISSNVLNPTISGSTFMTTTPYGMQNLYTNLSGRFAINNIAMNFGMMGATIAVVPDTTGPTSITPVLNESFLVFGSLPILFYGGSGAVQQPIYSTQTTAMIEALQATPLTNIIAAGQAILFQIINVPTNLPIGYAKFNFPGYWTVPASPTNVIAQYNQYEFVPIQIMDMTTPIPQSATMSQNAMLVQSCQEGPANHERRIREVTEQVMSRLQAMSHTSDPPEEEDDGENPFGSHQL